MTPKGGTGGLPNGPQLLPEGEVARLREGMRENEIEETDAVHRFIEAGIASPLDVDLDFVWDYAQELLGCHLRPSDYMLEMGPTEKQDYRMTEEGLIWIKDQDTEPKPKRLTNFQIRLVREIIRDDGVETDRSFLLIACIDGHLQEVTVPAQEFPRLDWVFDDLGGRAVLTSGHWARDKIREAIQLLSPEIDQERVLTHTGWARNLEEPAYVHASGAVGPEGDREDVTVELPGSLGDYDLSHSLGAESDPQEVGEAVIHLLEVAPDPIMVPLLAAVGRAPLGDPDFSIHIAGHTGTGKSELAALVQQFWGRRMDARNLPGSWTSTANAIERTAFLVKDAIFVLDDFAPQGSRGSVESLHAKADRLIRSQGNKEGRARMTREGEIKAGKPPRCLIVSTGEDAPRGQSLRARMLILEVEAGDVQWDPHLTRAQNHAERGLFARFMAAYVRRLSSRRDQLLENLEREVEKTRRQLEHELPHRRTADIVGQLRHGWTNVVSFLEHMGAVDLDEAYELKERGYKVLTRVAADQGSLQETENPVDQFLQALGSALTAGRAHVRHRRGGPPEGNPGSWGWEFQGLSGGDDPKYRPSCDCIGWLDGDEVYLDPGAGYNVAQRFARADGSTLAVTKETLQKRLREQGVLLAHDEGRTTTKKTVEGARKRVLVLPAEEFVETESTGQQQIGEG